MEVVCIDDTNRPVEIPIEKWLVKDNVYTVLNVVKTLDNNTGFVLKEITLTDDNFPFRCFAHNRFRLKQQYNHERIEIINDEKAEEAVKELIKETCPIEN